MATNSQQDIQELKIGSNNKVELIHLKLLVLDKVSKIRSYEKTEKEDAEEELKFTRPEESKR